MDENDDQVWRAANIARGKTTGSQVIRMVGIDACTYKFCCYDIVTSRQEHCHKLQPMEEGAVLLQYLPDKPVTSVRYNPSAQRLPGTGMQVFGSLESTHVDYHTLQAL